LVLVGYAVLQAPRSPTYVPRADRDMPPLGVGARLLLAGVLLLVLGPFVTLIIGAVRYQGHWSLAPFLLLVHGPSIGPYTVAHAAENSLVFATTVAAVALPLAFAAVVASRVLPRVGAAWAAALLLPLGTSSVLLGLGMLVTFDGQPAWDLRSHPIRIVLAHLLIAFPFVTRVLQPARDAIAPRLREAARSLGARMVQSFLRVELPLLRPALVAAAVYAFAVSLGEFGATLVLRRPEFTTLPLALFDAYARPGPAFQAQAHAIAVLLALVALVSFLLLDHARAPAGGLA
jgi:thiamine transport system permease protein